MHQMFGRWLGILQQWILPRWILQNDMDLLIGRYATLMFCPSSVDNRVEEQGMCDSVVQCMISVPKALIPSPASKAKQKFKSQLKSHRKGHTLEASLYFL